MPLLFGYTGLKLRVTVSLEVNTSASQAGSSDVTSSSLKLDSRLGKSFTRSEREPRSFEALRDGRYGVEVKIKSLANNGIRPWVVVSRGADAELRWSEQKGTSSSSATKKNHQA